MADRQIPSRDYDLGHSFTTRMGGMAYTRNLCVDEVDTGDKFYLVAAHEFGHGAGAAHTCKFLSSGVEE